MAKINSATMRVDPELNKLIREFATNNNMTIRQASREIAKNINKMKFNKVKFIKEINF